MTSEPGHNFADKAAKPVREVVSYQALEESIAHIAETVADKNADSVDRDARFPVETMDALKEIGALSAVVPEPLGGAGCSISELAALCHTLAHKCSSSAMILAMHYIKVDSMVKHCGADQESAEYLNTLCNEQRLVASVTSEVGTDGDMQRSVCGVERADGRYALKKHATTISYAQYADDLMLTAKSAPDANESDQVLVLAKRGEFELDQVGTWDTLGMRGTCSPPAIVTAQGDDWQVLPTPFSSVASHSMVPVSHILWSSVWLGIASEAVNRLRQHVKNRARKTGDAGIAGSALEQQARRLHSLEAELSHVTQWYERLLASGKPINLFNLDFALALNNLKLSVSEGCIEVVSSAFRAIGINAYRNGQPESLGRQLRDVMSAPLMINNERLMQYNAELQMSVKSR